MGNLTTLRELQIESFRTDQTAYILENSGRESKMGNSVCGKSLTS